MRRTSDEGRVSVLGLRCPVDRSWILRLVRAELDLDARRLRFFALRWREPEDQRSSASSLRTAGPLVALTPQALTLLARAEFSVSRRLWHVAYCVLCDEHVLDPATKCLRDEERKGQRGVETPAFDRDDRLPGDAERACEVGLSPFASESSFGDVVPHLTAR